jgi:hypothetical protein
MKSVFELRNFVTGSWLIGNCNYRNTHASCYSICYLAQYSQVRCRGYVIFIITAFVLVDAYAMCVIMLTLFQRM